MTKPAKKKTTTLHDTLFKWLIDAYINEFFELFFPQIKTTNITDKNKEFLERFENNKAPVNADFFLGMQAIVQDEPSDILIIVELKSQKEDIRQQISKYFGHAFTVEQKPVWAIVLFTDDADWKNPVPNRIPLSFSSEHGFSYLNIDIIKLKDHSAEKLSKHRTLLAKILALKANDQGINRETLLREIYRAAAPLQDTLPKYINLLIERFVEAYSKLPQERVEKIKQETAMTVTAANIGEYYELMGEHRARIAEKRKTLALLEKLNAAGRLANEDFEAEAAPIRAELQQLEAETFE